ncbi:MAG: biotin/lipoyl-containing protein [bacterium]
MDIQKIGQILDLIKKTGFVEVELEQDGIRIKARKPPPSFEGKKAVESPPPTNGYDQIKSQAIGFFHSLKARGEVFQAGQMLCRIITPSYTAEFIAEKDGKIVEILVETGKPVQYGTPLFLFEPVGACSNGNGHKPVL